MKLTVALRNFANAPTKQKAADREKRASVIKEVIQARRSLLGMN
jgi:hypothetical protein